MDQSNRLGTELENAVRAIEQMIISQNPALSQAPFKIEPKHIVSLPNGERHEIDVLVTINDGSTYASLHAFECKNRQDPASQSDVTVLADKVRVLSVFRSLPTKGILVSRAFTSCAKAKAEANGIQLVPFDDAVWFPLASLNVSGVGFTIGECRTKIRSWIPGAFSAPADPVTTPCKFREHIMRFPEFLHFLATRRLRSKGALAQGAGEYSGQDACGFSFAKEELTIDGCEIDEIELHFSYQITIRPGHLLSTFSIQDKGRFAKFECAPDGNDGQKLTVEIIGPVNNSESAS
jgi:hypothetical protein